MSEAKLGNVVTGFLSALIVYAAISTLLWLGYLFIHHSHTALPDISWAEGYVIYLAWTVAQVRIVNGLSESSLAEESDTP